MNQKAKHLFKSKFTPAEMEEIKAKYRLSVYTYRKLADEYGVTTSTIYRIISKNNDN